MPRAFSNFLFGDEKPLVPPPPQPDEEGFFRALLSLLQRPEPTPQPGPYDDLSPEERQVLSQLGLRMGRGAGLMPEEDEMARMPISVLPRRGREAVVRDAARASEGSPSGLGAALQEAATTELPGAYPNAYKDVPVLGGLVNLSKRIAPEVTVSTPHDSPLDLLNAIPPMPFVSTIARPGTAGALKLAANLAGQQVEDVAKAAGPAVRELATSEVGAVGGKVQLLAEGAEAPAGMSKTVKGGYTFAVPNGMSAQAREAAMSDLVKPATTQPVKDLDAAIARIDSYTPEMIAAKEAESPGFADDLARWKEELKFSKESGWKTTRISMTPPEGYKVEYRDGKAWYVKAEDAAPPVEAPATKRTRAKVKPSTNAAPTEPPAPLVEDMKSAEQVLVDKYAKLGIGVGNKNLTIELSRLYGRRPTNEELMGIGARIEQARLGTTRTAGKASATKRATGKQTTTKVEVNPAGVEDAKWAEIMRLSAEVKAGRMTREEASAAVSKLLPPEEVPPVGQSAPTTNATGGVHDPLNLRPDTDIANNPELTDTGLGGVLRRMLAARLPLPGGKALSARAFAERIQPGITYPTDTLTAIGEEHTIGRVKAEGYATHVTEALRDTPRDQMPSMINDIAEVVEQTALKYGMDPKDAAGYGASIRTIADDMVSGKLKNLNKVATSVGEEADSALRKTLNKWYTDKAQATGLSPDLIKARMDFQLSGARDQSGYMGMVNNFLRLMGAAADLSATGIQLLVLGANHPKALAKAVGYGLAAWIPRKGRSIIAQLNVREAETIKDMQSWGVRWSEMNPIVEGQAGKFVPHNVPVVGEVYKGSDLAFSSMGNIMRLNVWKALRKHMGSDEELRLLAEYLNRSTGVTSSRVGGIEKNIFFAAKYVRSPFEVLHTLMKRSVLGTEARNVVGTFVGAGSLLLAYDQLFRGHQIVIDPDDSNFLTVRDINNVDFQPYGPLTPYLKVFAISVKHGPMAAGKAAQEGKLDPLVAVQLLKGAVIDGPLWFVGNKTAPVIGLGRTLASGETFGGDYIGSLGDALKVQGDPKLFDWGKFFTGLVGNTMAPFSYQGIQKARERGALVGKITGSPEEEAKTIGTAAAQSILGLKGQPLSAGELLRKVLQQQHIVGDITEQEAKSLEDLGPKQRAQFYKDNPLAKEIAESGSEAHGPIADYRTIRDQYYGAQEQQDKALEEKQISVEEWKDARTERYNKVRGALELAMKDAGFQKYLERVKEKPQGEKDKALGEYYKLAEEYAGPGGLGMKPGYFDATETYLLSLPDDQRRYIEANIGINRTPKEEEYAKAMKKLRPYLGAQDDYIKKQSDNIRSELERVAAIPKNTPERRLAEKNSAAWQRMQDKLEGTPGVKGTKEKLLALYPDMKELLSKWFGALTEEEQKSKQKTAVTGR